jgi:hypothetical protein
MVGIEVVDMVIEKFPSCAVDTEGEDRREVPQGLQLRRPLFGEQGHERIAHPSAEGFDLVGDLDIAAVRGGDDARFGEIDPVAIQCLSWVTEYVRVVEHEFDEAALEVFQLPDPVEMFV